MHYSILSFWQHQENLPAGHPDKLSPRVNRLLQHTFEQWRGKPAWPRFGIMGHLFDYYKGDALKKVKAAPVAVRKGLAVKQLLQIISGEKFAATYGTAVIHPDEIIVGSLPPYSVGQGKELMRYLTEEEALFNEIRYYNEWSPFGHIVPNHEKVLQRGLSDIIRECTTLQKKTKEQKKKDFYASVIAALEGVLLYTANYVRLIEKKAKYYKTTDPQRYQQLMEAAGRLKQVPAGPPRNFTEAVQCIYILHCALHFSGEIVPLGRLDQLLGPFYEKDIKEKKLTRAGAREILECLWIKLDEKVVLNNRFLEDRFTSSDGALLGSGAPSNFDQGGLANQWMQQITIGGVLATNDAVAKDASNEITRICLEATRRLPVNSPTLDLRVHKKTPEDILELAAAALLSGGAHPVLLNDDKIIPALHKKTGGQVALKSARNYACDGCYETLFAGETEFSFGFVAALDVLEKALNSGAGFAFSGPVYLRGSKGSWRTPPAAEIKSFDQFWQILRSHILLGCHKFYSGILAQYGTKEDVSPSPLLSALIDGCIESGRDLSGGGARYHLFSPLMTGISTATDSLYVIKKLVFEEKRFSLEELVSCLRSNWGRSPATIGLQLPADRIRTIRQWCLEQPRFGHGHKATDQLAWKLIGDFYDCLKEAKQSPVHKEQWATLAKRYDIPGQRFEILIAPGVGTFEQYVFGGSFAGATPDGRFAFDPIASDLSPAPLHSDLSPYIVMDGADGIPAVSPVKTTRIQDALLSYDHDSVNLLSDGGPCDLNIAEDFPPEKLKEILQQFAAGKGSNVMTITTASPETFYKAAQHPEQYELLRVRMGGWTEFFITLFPAHREQHQRRPVYTHQ